VNQDLKSEVKLDRSAIFGTIIKITTYIFLILLIIVDMWTSDGHLSYSTVSVVLFLTGYTLLLVLPFRKFKLSPSSFEGELENLIRTAPTQRVPSQAEKHVAREVEKVSQGLIDKRSVMLELSIRIEGELKRIAGIAGLSLRDTRQSVGQLIQILQKKEIITDTWLIKALEFFRSHRNELVHTGSTNDIDNAIKVGEVVLAKLSGIRRAKVS
jgi:hypothetical protein